MHNSKLYSILHYFDKYEQNRLRKYLCSPYFNKNKILIELYNFLIDHINAKTHAELEKEAIWEMLYGGEKYDDVRYRKHCSDLLKLIEGYLAQQIYDENPLHQATYLLQAVGRKKTEKLYNSTVKTARRLSNQQLHRSANYYYYQYQIERNYYELSELEHNRTSKRNVEEILNNLDRFFLAEKLRYYCSVLSQQFVTSHEYKVLFIDEIISHIEKYHYQDVPPIAIYYQVYLTHVDADNPDHYFKLKILLEKYGDLLPLHEAEEVYQSALNYCVRKLNQGNQQFHQEYFDLYVVLLKKGLLFTDGELSPWHFRNIVVIALRLGKYDWTENFIRDYQTVLPEAFRENAVSFNLAQLYFYQKKYKKVIELLQTVEYEDFSYNLNSKSLLLIIYYETDEIEPLYSLLESFRVYLNRHKDIPVNRRKSFLNLIKYIKKITKIMPGDKKSIQKLKEEIEVDKNIASRKWLKEKIVELE